MEGLKIQHTSPWADSVLKGRAQDWESFAIGIVPRGNFYSGTR